MRDTVFYSTPIYRFAKRAAWILWYALDVSLSEVSKSSEFGFTTARKCSEQKDILKNFVSCAERNSGWLVENFDTMSEVTALRKIDQRRDRKVDLELQFSELLVADGGACLRHTTDLGVSQLSRTAF